MKLLLEIYASNLFPIGFILYVCYMQNIIPSDIRLNIISFSLAGTILFLLISVSYFFFFKLYYFASGEDAALLSHEI